MRATVSPESRRSWDAQRTAVGSRWRRLREGAHLRPTVSLPTLWVAGLLQGAVWAYVIVEWDVAAAKPCFSNDLRPADPVHPEMAKVLALRIPPDEIPERRQDQHRLRLDFAP